VAVPVLKVDGEECEQLDEDCRAHNDVDEGIVDGGGDVMVEKIMGERRCDAAAPYCLERNYAVLANKLHRRAEAHANG
jgi:hypothetical protein